MSDKSEVQITSTMITRNGFITVNKYRRSGRDSMVLL